MPLWRQKRACSLPLLLTLVWSLTSCASTRQSPLYLVTVPVADLRAHPDSVATPGTHDPAQETQVLYGERVRLIKTQDDWSLVNVIEQPEYTHHRRWEGYPGWIRNDQLVQLQDASRPTAIVTAKWATIWQDDQGVTPLLHVPMGTTLCIDRTPGEHWRVSLPNRAIGWISKEHVQFMRALVRRSSAERRQMIVQAASQFLGDPYFWGGRSPYAESPSAVVTGVDCSGLVNLAYRTAGIEIPRDAHEQYLRARKIATPQPADLVFLSDADHPEKIVHVMLFAGNGQLIEGPGTGLAIRRINATDRLGRPLEELKPGDSVNQQTLYFGAYLP